MIFRQHTAFYSIFSFTKNLSTRYHPDCCYMASLIHIHCAVEVFVVRKKEVSIVCFPYENVKKITKNKKVTNFHPVARLLLSGRIVCGLSGKARLLAVAD